MACSSFQISCAASLVRLTFKNAPTATASLRGYADKVHRVRVRAQNSDSDAAEVPPGCSRIKVELSKPLGIVLEEDKAGNIFVAELVTAGNAEQSGLVDVGDQLIATSAVVYGNAEDYQGVKVRKGMQVVRFNVRGERFETVMAAIGTHPGYMKVTLELQKCKVNSSDVQNGASKPEQSLGTYNESEHTYLYVFKRQAQLSHATRTL